MLHTKNNTFKTIPWPSIPTKIWIVYLSLILYVPVNNFSVMSGQIFLGWTGTKQGLMCLAQGHNPVMTVRLELATPRSRVKHSTTEFPNMDRWAHYTQWFWNHDHNQTGPDYTMWGVRSGSVVECLTRDREAAGSSLTGVTALWSLSKTHLS